MAIRDTINGTMISFRTTKRGVTAYVGYDRGIWLPVIRMGNSLIARSKRKGDTVVAWPDTSTAREEIKKNLKGV